MTYKLKTILHKIMQMFYIFIPGLNGVDLLFEVVGGFEVDEVGEHDQQSSHQRVRLVPLQAHEQHAEQIPVSSQLLPEENNLLGKVTFNTILIERKI